MVKIRNLFTPRFWKESQDQNFQINDWFRGFRSSRRCVNGFWYERAYFWSQQNAKCPKIGFPDEGAWFFCSKPSSVFVTKISFAYCHHVQKSIFVIVIKHFKSKLYPRGFLLKNQIPPWSKFFKIQGPFKQLILNLASIHNIIF